ncbi:MAG: calcium/sodium antiporter [Sedimentisphaerales bacterium]|nr:calcium/sodium antiporter [Sedimentisphaerales bacterium]
MLQYILLVIGFILLIKGADLLVDGASSVGRRLNISDLVIGLTVVAFGTSSPELFVNIFASIKGNTEIAIGNVLGSNIANIFLILGVSAVIFPLAVGKGTVWKEIPLSLLAALLLGVVANDRLIDKSEISALTRIDGLVFLAFFIIFLYYTFGIAKRIEGIDSHVPQKQYSLLKSLLFVIAGLVGLGIGGNLIVDAAEHIASRLGVSQSLIGLTIVAVGTSLPELATSSVAAYRKNAEIAVGNIVGSNIFNIFFVLGISAVIKPLPFNPNNNIDIGAVIIASLLLFLWMFTGKRRSLDRWEGIIFLILYNGYITFLVYKK